VKVRCFGNSFVEIDDAPITHTGRSFVSVRIMHELGAEPKNVGEFDVPVCNVPAFVAAVLAATVPVLSQGEDSLWLKNCRDNQGDRSCDDSDSVGFVVRKQPVENEAS